MRYVLDTNIVSALRVPSRHPQVARWADGMPRRDLYLAAPTLAEIERGVIRKEATDPAQGRALRVWFEHGVLAGFGERILPFDREAARILARYPVPQDAPLDDALIAAVAEAHGMTVVTRNVRHFAPTGVALLNPWEV